MGPSSFISTITELKPYLKFTLCNGTKKLDKNTHLIYDILFFHEDILNNDESNNIIDSFNSIKILATKKINKISIYDDIVKLPTSLSEINQVIEKAASKKIFIKNSSIKIKEYILDKNKKKLSKSTKSLIITEKEVQLLELLLQHTKPITKNKILSSAWNYSSEADTHTLETHIYRLRKKISKTFNDNKFILNNKEGYYL